jgi:hypothetical protein
MVRDNLQGGSACSTAALQISIKTEGYTCYNEGAWSIADNESTPDVNETSSGGTLNVQVAYGSENVSLSGINIIPKLGGEGLGKYLVTEGLPETGLTKVLSINLTEKPDEVAIMPVVMVGESDKECSTTEYVAVLNC